VVAWHGVCARVCVCCVCVGGVVRVIGAPYVNHGELSIARGSGC
jgi:hypothetical protein